MITITDKAKSKIDTLMQDSEMGSDYFLRVSVKGGGCSGLSYNLVTSNPWFYIALTTMVLGTQLFLAGFLGEIILRTKNNEGRYKVSSEINF